MLIELEINKILDLHTLVSFGLFLQKISEEQEFISCNEAPWKGEAAPT